MTIQCQTPTNGNTFYWYLKDDKIIPMTNNDVNVTGWSRPYRRLIQQAAWEFVFAGGNNGVTIEAFSNHLDRHQQGFASRLIGIMEQCGIWQIRVGNIFRNPEVDNFERCKDILRKYYDEPTNHVPVFGQVQPVLPIPLAPTAVRGKVNENNPPDGQAQAIDARHRGHHQQNNNRHHGIMPTEEQITVLSTAIANYLVNFDSINDGIYAAMPMNEKLDILYDWPKPPNIQDRFNIQLEGNTSARQTISLKNQLNNLLQNLNPNGKIALLRWFVDDWGNIHEKGPIETRDQYQNNRFQNWINALGNVAPHQNANLPFIGIASWSKVACIICPTRYAIYDARVARSINSISMLKLGDNGLRLPQSSSINSKLCLAEVDFRRIVNVIPVEDNQIHIDDLLQIDGKLFRGYSKIKERFLERKISQPNNVQIVQPRNAYITYLNLLGQVSDQLFRGDVNCLQKTEMLLFALADHRGLYIPVIRKLKGWPDVV